MFVWIGRLVVFGRLFVHTVGIAGKHGMTLVWQGRNWESLEQFTKRQKIWQVVGGCILIVQLSSLAGGYIL